MKDQQNFLIHLNTNMKLMWSFFQFLNQPYSSLSEKHKGLKKRGLLVLLIFNIVASGFLTGLLHTLFGIEDKEITEVVILINCSPLFYVLSWFLSAVKEEIGFRLFLGEFRLSYFRLSIAILISDMLVRSIGLFVDFSLSDYCRISYFLLLITLSIGCFFITKGLFKNKEKSFKKIFDLKYSILIYFSVFLSGLWHVIFSGQTVHLNIPIVFIVHAFNAFILCFVRINFGILAAIVYHFVFNMPFILSVLYLA